MSKQSKQSKKSKQPGLTTTVSGAKDLDEYIAQVSVMITQIQENFMRELADSEAGLRSQRCRGSSHDFAMEMCAITHGDLIYTETVLPQSSAFLQALAVANECLDQLEALRKMLVNNKQQKKTAVRRLREFRNYIGSMVESFALQNMVLGTSTGTGAPKKTSILEERRDREELQTRKNLLELSMELEPAESKPTSRMIQDMIEMTKQNHRTVSKGLIDQVNTLMFAMRTRYIRSLVEVAERTVGAVMEHEKKCQAFMTQCLRLSAIEYCAKIWWFGTQNPDPNPNSSKNYYIRAQVVHDYGDAVEGKPPTCLDHHFKASRAAAYFEFCAENRPAPRICITVHGDPDPAHGNTIPLICKYDFDQELAETILTDEAIDQFEETRRA